MIPSKSEIKLIRSLAKRKNREENRLFVVEGEKLVQEALESGWEIVKIFQTDDIGEDMMARITLLSSPSPSLAIVKMPIVDNTFIPDPKSLSIALDSVKDPGNLGTIVRLAEWFGIDTIYCSKDCVDLYNPKTVQSTMGAVFRVKVIYTDLTSLIKNISDKIEIFGTFLEGENIYKKTLPESAMIVMGNESVGISPEVTELIDKRLTIPDFSRSKKSSESLNVAIATAVICSEFRRFSV